MLFLVYLFWFLVFLIFICKMFSFFDGFFLSILIDFEGFRNLMNFQFRSDFYQIIFS
jgi:hypothetical protein